MGKTRCYKLKDGTSYPDEAQSIPTSNDDSWDNMTCDWTANGYRLPTECEWECAARGGKYSTGTPWTYTYSGSNTIDNVAWYWDDSKQISHTWEVGLKNANDIGLYDMSGNVWEWCWDYSNNINSDTPATGPDTSSNPSNVKRRQRGGGWCSNSSSCTVSYQDYGSPYSITCEYYGFRIACSGE